MEPQMNTDTHRLSVFICVHLWFEPLLEESLRETRQ
jgi:hypothetical protein